VNKEYIEKILNCSIRTILRVGKIMLGVVIVMTMLAVIYKVFAIDRVDVNSESVSKKEICGLNQNDTSADVNGDVEYHDIFMRGRKENLRCIKFSEIKVNPGQINLISGSFRSWTMPSMRDVKSTVYAFIAEMRSVMGVKPTIGKLMAVIHKWEQEDLLYLKWRKKNNDS
jgi:hypothetical protein